MKLASRRDLVHAAKRFRSVSAAIPDGMVLLDVHNRIRWANPQARTHLGVSWPGDAGHPLLDFVRQPDFARYLLAPDSAEPTLLESQREPGVTLSVQLVRAADDERLLISRDVSSVEAVARMRRDFIANVSHELKTPLTVVAGFIETLMDMDLEPRQRDRYLQLMHEQAGSMQRLVSDLLTLSTLESEQHGLQESAFPVAPLVLEMVASAKGLSKRQHAVAMEMGEDAVISGSRDELASAFGNLVSNAIRYTPANGSVTLSWRVDGDGTGVFAVKDTGIGIAPEHVPRLTERFYRVDRSRSRATGGTGLGLAIVKHVLLRHHATLEITSELGVGSAFAVRLPAARVARSVPTQVLALAS